MNDRPGKDSLAALKDVVGLFAALGVIVYVLGGAVLAARLAIEDLPGEAVLAQLPREFLISIGVSQVLLPALVVATLHIAVRGLNVSNNKAKKGYLIAGGLAWYALFLALAAYTADARSGGANGLFQGDPVFWSLSCGVLGVAVLAAVIVRWHFAKGRLRWRSGPPWLSLTIAYGVVAMVASAAVAGTFPLLDARACLSAGSAKNGDLIGQSSGRIFLGEPTASQRRIASLRADLVDELFIGSGAEEALCDPVGRANTGSVTVAAEDAVNATRVSRRAHRRIRRARTLSRVAAAGHRMLESLRRSSDAGSTAVAAAYRFVDAAGATELRGDIDRVEDAVQNSKLAEERLGSQLSDADSPDRSRRLILRSVRLAAAAAQRRSNVLARRVNALAARMRGVSAVKGG